MPLPHFLMILAAVILAALITIWAALAAGMAPLALGIVLLIAAAVLQVMRRTSPDQDGRKHH